MALNVISNFAANVAHRNLVQSDASATASLAKLSAGTRVLSAKDDAASLAIGSRLRAEVVAMTQAAQNASQAASMLQIADGALGTIADILVRLKALAVQASSGQFSQIERSVLNSEYQSLTSEITRISDDTEFNGTALISGGAAVFDANGDSTTGDKLVVGTTGEFTAGSAPGFSLTLDTANTTINNAAFRLSYANSAEVFTLTNIETGVSQVIDITTVLNTALTANSQTTTDNSLTGSATLAINFTSLGVTLTMDSNFARNNATLDTLTPTNSATLNGGANSVTVTTHTVTFASSGVNNADLIQLIGLGTYTAATGILTLNTTNSVNGTVVLDGVTGLQFSINGAGLTADNTASAAITSGSNGTIIVAAAGTDSTLFSVDFTNMVGDTGAGTITLDIGELVFGTAFTAGTTSQQFTFKVGTGSESQDDLTFTINAASSTILGLASTVITDATSANVASAAVSSAIDTINQQRATIGAAQNRLSFAANNLASAKENSEAARSALMDLDIAAEMAAFTSKQILVQTGISMLAQANAGPQNLLRLFQ